MFTYAYIVPAGDSLTPPTVRIPYLVDGSTDLVFVDFHSAH